MVKISCSDGMEREIYFSLSVLEKIEEVTGESALDASLYQNLTAKKIKILIWAAFQDKYPEMSLELVGKLLSNCSIKDLTLKIKDALEEAFQDKEPEKKTDG
jgi:hypothetical protein